MIRRFLVLLSAPLLLCAAFTAGAQEITHENPLRGDTSAVPALTPAQELCVVITDKMRQTPEVQYTPPPKPKYWKRGLITQIGLSQVSLTNWAAGGYGSLALNAYVNAYANYAKSKMIWTNDLQLGYGFINSFTENGFKKSDDRLILNSKWGWQVIKTLYASAVFNYNMTLFPGYKGDALVSHIFSPAYTTLGVGLDWNPAKWMSVNFAPLTGKLVIVADSTLRSTYGNAALQAVRPEFGAQLKVDNKFTVFKNIRVESKLTLFSDYLNKPQNVVVNWDVAVDGKLTRNLSYSIRTNLIYDDNIKFLDSSALDAEGNPVKVQAVQFKEVCSFAFTYTFGDTK